MAATCLALIQGTSEVEHERLKCLSLLLQIPTASFADRAQGLADVGQVAEGDARLLSHRSLHGRHGRDWFALFGDRKWRGAAGANTFWSGNFLPSHEAKHTM